MKGIRGIEAGRRHNVRFSGVMTNEEIIAHKVMDRAERSEATLDEEIAE
jgi:hypothetical protein